jgi:putative transposase
VNAPKCSDDDYIDFVIATPRSVSATEAAKVQGDEEQAPAHDAFTRLLHRLEPDAETLWREAESQVNLSQGILVIDDSTLDKPYAKKIELVTRHWSGKHHAVVRVALQRLFSSAEVYRVPFAKRRSRIAKRRRSPALVNHFRLTF